MSRHLLRIVVASPDRRRVLARPNGLAGWILPVVPTAGDDPAWTATEDEAARRLVGADLAPVRRLDDRTWELEPLGRVPAVGNTWIAPAEASRLGADADAVQRWADAESAPPAAPHLRPGWRASIDAWIDDRVGGHDRTEVLRHWELAAVVTTSAGDRPVVVKEAAPGFDREGAVLAALAGLPGAPVVLDVDGARVATAWAGRPGLASAAAAAEALGRLQRRSGERLGALAAAGCPPVDEVVADVHPAIDEALAMLAALDLPTGVVHGDAHGANVVGDEDPTFVDWGDATVGCPAVDLDLLLGHDDPPPGTVEEIIGAWARGLGCDPTPVRDALPAVRAVAAALAVGLHRRHRRDVPATLRARWDGWLQGWEARLDRFVG